MTHTDTPQQIKTVENLTSLLDDFETAHDFDGALIFKGDSADGPAVGQIEADGSIYWIVGEVPV